MKLSISDRMAFPQLYPEQGNIIQQLLVKSIAEKVQITLDEAKMTNLKQEGSLLTWDNKKAKDKHIAFSETEINFLKQQVKRLDESNKITQSLLNVCILIQDYKDEDKKS